MTTAATPVASARSVLRIGVLTAVAAALTFGTLVFAGRELGPEGYARFMVVWAVFFAAVGFWQGLQQEITRLLSSSQLEAGPRGLSVTGASARLGVVGAVVVGGLALVVGPGAVGLDASTSVVLGIGIFTYAVANGIHGALSAAGEWRLYGRVMLLESMLRSLVLVVVLVVTSEPAAQAVALVSGSLAWLVISVRGPARRAVRVRLPTDLRRFGLRVGQAVAAAACSVLVIAGFPVLLEVTTSQPLDADAGVLLASLVLTRAPVLLIMSALQGVFLTRLVAAGDGRVAVLRTWLGLLGLAMGPVIVAGYLAGPSLITAVLGENYATTGSMVVGLSLGAGSVLALTLTGWTTLSAGRHLANLLGWATALLATVSLLLLPASIEARSITALVAGPVMGAVLHLLVLQRVT